MAGFNPAAGSWGRRLAKRLPLIRSLGRERPKVADWPRLFGSERPKICAAVGVSMCGSHLVLHKIHSHPNFMVLNEKVPHPDRLKIFFTRGDYPIDDLRDGQLLPPKKNLKEVKWLFFNKPDIETMAYHLHFHRNETVMFYCFRNPVGLYRSWARDWKIYGRRNYGAEPDQAEVDRWFEATLMSSLVRFAAFHDARRDFVVNLEAFAANWPQSLEPICERLGVPLVGAEELMELEFCVQCGGPLKEKEIEVKDRRETALYCDRCDRLYLGPGGYNYIRRINRRGFALWKERPETKELADRFSALVGEEVMGYFLSEKYLSDPRGEAFEEVFRPLLADLSGRLLGPGPAGGGRVDGPL